MKNRVTVLIPLLLVLFVAACGGSPENKPVGGLAASPTPAPAPVLSSSKAITAFSFTSPAATGVISEATKAISVTVPYGTSLTALIASFTTTGSSVTIGSTV